MPEEIISGEEFRRRYGASAKPIREEIISGEEFRIRNPPPTPKRGFLGGMAHQFKSRFVPEDATLADFRPGLAAKMLFTEPIETAKLIGENLPPPPSTLGGGLGHALGTAIDPLGTGRRTLERIPRAWDRFTSEDYSGTGEAVGEQVGDLAADLATILPIGRGLRGKTPPKAPPSNVSTSIPRTRVRTPEPTPPTPTPASGLGEAAVGMAGRALGVPAGLAKGAYNYLRRGGRPTQAVPPAGLEMEGASVSGFTPGPGGSLPLTVDAPPPRVAPQISSSGTQAGPASGPLPLRVPAKEPPPPPRMSTTGARPLEPEPTLEVVGGVPSANQVVAAGAAKDVLRKGLAGEKFPEGTLFRGTTVEDLANVVERGEFGPGMEGGLDLASSIDTALAYAGKGEGTPVIIRFKPGIQTEVPLTANVGGQRALGPVRLEDIAEIYAPTAGGLQKLSLEDLLTARRMGMTKRGYAPPKKKR